MLRHCGAIVHRMAGSYVSIVRSRLAAAPGGKDSVDAMRFLVITTLLLTLVHILYCPGTAMADSSTYTEEIIPSGYIDPSTGVETVYSVYSVQTPEGNLSLELPKGAVISKTQITITQAPLESLIDSVPPPPSGLRFASTSFSIEGIETLEEKSKLFVRYSEEDLAASEGSPHLLVLARYDEGKEEWTTDFTKSVEPTHNLVVSTDELGLWAVMVEEPADVFPVLSRGVSVVVGLVVGLGGAVAVGILLDRKVFRGKQPSA